jgi:NhaP-type Na+/H+ or K+/H+ antiporter
MTFSVLVLSQGIAAGSTIFNLAALTVFCSIIAHGVTDTGGAEWLARYEEAKAAAAEERRRQLEIDGALSAGQ